MDCLWKYFKSLDWIPETSKFKSKIGPKIEGLESSKGGRQKHTGNKTEQTGNEKQRMKDGKQ